MSSSKFRFNNLSLIGRVWAVMIMIGLSMLIAMGISAWGLLESRASLNTLHQDRMLASENIRTMILEQYESRLNILLGFQHDPESPLISLHGHPLSDHTNVIARAEQSWRDHWKSLTSRDLDAKESELLNKIDSQVQAWNVKARDAVNRLNASDFSPESMQQFLVSGRTEFDTLLRSLVDLQNYQSQMADLAVQQADENFNLIIVLFAIFIILLLLPGIILMAATMRRLSGGLNQTMQNAQAIAQGDLSQNFYDDARDELGVLSGQMRTMRENLNQLIHRIVIGANSIGAAADEVAGGTHDLSARTVEQAAALEETSAGTEELNATVHQNADNAIEVDRMAKDTANLAERGGQVTNDAVATMEEIHEASEKIGDIVNIIDGIAFQTNILALNAAVEAARAGEAGRGFAVVAGEVRALAQRSASAANEIKEVIQETVDMIRSGSDQVSEAGVAMNEIVERFRNMTTLIGEIAGASKEQAIGLQQINQAVTEMDDATQQNSTLVDSTLHTAEEMQRQADIFRQLVSAFRLSEEDAMGREVIIENQARPHSLENNQNRLSLPSV